MPSACAVASQASLEARRRGEEAGEGDIHVSPRTCNTGSCNLTYPLMIHRPQKLTSASPWLLWLQGIGTRAEDEGEDGPPPAGEEEAAPAEAPFVAGSWERCALLAASPIVLERTPVVVVWVDGNEDGLDSASVKCEGTG